MRSRTPSAVRIDCVRLVVLAGGRSRRMGFDKLTADFAGEPLAHRLARRLLELEPLFVATPAVADAVADLPGVSVIATAPTAGPSETLALAHAATAADAYLAVVPCDLPFIDAARVRSFIASVLDEPDLAWPLVAGTPGHPVLWSPNARARIAALRADEPPSRLRSDPALRVAAIDVDDDAHAVDADTPDAWESALRRARAEDHR